MIKFFLALCFVTTTAFAQYDLDFRILTPTQIVNLIGKYPRIGSPESQADFDTLMKFQKTRTEQDCAFARHDEEISVNSMFGGPQGILNADEVVKMESFLFKAKAAAGTNSTIGKQIYKRPRPYITNPELKPCISLAGGYAYPSGHSLVAQLYGRILSKVYPERAEAFMKRAMQFSMNRVLGGVHHPSDVRAAHKIADHLALKMVEQEHFFDELQSL